MGGRVVNDNDSERIWKEAITAKFEALARHFLIDAGEKQANSQSRE
jgi:hypothetical protein